MKQILIPIYSVTGYPQKNIPLALGVIEAYIHQYKNGLLNDKFHFLPFLNKPIDEIIIRARDWAPGIWLFSNYLWSIDRNLAISRAIKRIVPRNITIHGGPELPVQKDACREFLLMNEHIDIAVRGEGEVTTAELLEHIADYWDREKPINEALRKIAGISYRLKAKSNQSIIRTSDRPKIPELTNMPSPYLTGVFEKNDEFQEKEHFYAIFETNRGCPFQCAFCNWGSATGEKIRKFSMARIKAEMEYAAKRESAIFSFADSNFGMFERDVEIIDHLVALKQKYYYPKEAVICFTKNKPERVSTICSKLKNSGITFQCILSMQTRDETTLNIIKRQNIQMDHYDKLRTYLKNEKIPVCSEIILGLPGATIKSFKTDLQYFFDNNIEIYVHYAMVLNNTLMADPAYREKYRIKTDSQHFICSTFSYSIQDHNTMALIHKFYKIFINYALLKYMLKYVQMRYNITALDFIHKLVNFLENQNPVKFKLLNSIKRTRRSDIPILIKIISSHIESFFSEISDFIHQQYKQVKNDPAFETVLKVNQAIIPHPEKKYPFRVKLKHNFIGFYLDSMKNNMIPLKKLDDYPGSYFKVYDPYCIAKNLFSKGKTIQYMVFQTFFELESPLKQNQSVPHFIKKMQKSNRK